ncbi:hypothetical protein PybrP1_013103 [[Pythium] brassicae (nom. inval.)]|nr:hypothetical protein PybrP1_013103 [[Pythium] brassicae (nom. inval.)]
MQSPREISSANQGALTPSTARLVTKAAVARITAATPVASDGAASAVAAARTPWANLSVDTESPPGAASSSTFATTAAAEATATTTQRPHATAMRAGASNHVPLQPGLLPERYTADLTHWQSPADLPERRLMVQRIIAMTRNKRLSTAGLGVDDACGGADRTPSLAKRIELSLYSRAASFNEYRDMNTLRRRLQSLVSLSFHEAAVSRRAALESVAASAGRAPLLGKRKLRATPFGVSRLMIKRPRCAPAAPSASGVCSFETHAPCFVDYSGAQLQTRVSRGGHTRTHASCFSSSSSSAAAAAAAVASQSFFLTNEDVLRQIYAYLPGVETIRSLSVNTFAARVLPTCVFSLDVEVRAMQRAFESASASLLCRFANLARLNIYNAAKPCDQQEGGPSLHAWGCSELDISHDNAGEDVVKQLAEAIELGACRRLTSLRLVSVFTNTCRGNALHMLCAALVKGSCPDLEDLLLGGNGFSDVGTVDVAWLLRVGSLPRLTRLDIRRNYIGESGLKRVMAALSAGRCQRLKYLCMGGNIITDNCVAPVVELLSSSLCPQMRFLGLEDNFLSARGVHCIIQAAVAGGMMPKLHHVSSDGRGGTDEVADTSMATLAPPAAVLASAS